ncbi:MAG: hypothetical protein H6Q73_3572 [Firmicutes bacterium]|nr:hypothetical protein [Bacillota bacterium]
MVEVITLAINTQGGDDIEFDKNISNTAMVNYSKEKSTGEIQDDLRKGKE